jgi:N-acetylmuramoyl-L-alanine amidase
VKTNKLIIHCADTPAGMDIGAAEIRRWHVQDNKWADIGYHYVVRRNGTVEKGRDDLTPGAHTRGHNHDSLGICLVGGKPGPNFTSRQWVTLAGLIATLKAQHPGAVVKGHRDYDSGKDCPGFDVAAFADGL